MSTTSGRTASSQREQLVESHLPLVRSIARRYAGRGEMLDDLVQVGSVGLVRASKHFDSGRGVSFAKFAAPAIEGEIRRHLDDRTTSVRVPRELQRLSDRLQRCRTDLQAELGRTPTVPELAQAMGVEHEDVERALGAERARHDVTTPGVETEADTESVGSIDDRLLLAASARVLSKRERRIVFMRFHADMTERDIARELGISQAHVSRLLAAALRKLREELNDATAKAAGTGGANTEDNRVPTKAMTTKPSHPGRGAEVSSANVASDPSRPAQAKVDPALPYHVTVKEDRDGESSWWIASLEELPSCQARGASPEEAVDRLRTAMQGWLSAAVAGQPQVEMPKQEARKRKSSTGHSGRFLVRMPSTLHEELSVAAERRHVSLNRFVTDALAAAVSEAPSDGTPEPATAPEVPPSRRKRLRMLVAANVAVAVLAAVVAVTLLILALERGI